MKFLVIIMCVLSCFQSFFEAAKILAIIPLHAKSHYTPFEPILKRLAEKGHELKVVSSFPQKNKIPNLIDVDISSISPKFMGTMDLQVVETWTSWSCAKFIWSTGAQEVCKPIFGHPGIKELRNSSEKFDLIITEIFTTDCFLGFVKKFDAPYIAIFSSVALPWIPDVLTNLENPSYIPNYFSQFSDRMNYFERLLNTVYYVVFKIGYKIYSDEPNYQIAKDYFGPDLPTLEELRSRVALVILNGHHSVTSTRPLAPGVKEVGGIHIPSSGPSELPGELKKYLDSAVEGVVYFSMGSIVNATLPVKILAILNAAFGDIPQQVLWKCGEHKTLQLPKNVKCLDWMPQLSVLCHPNVRVFISHGGLLGTQEAVYCGVPVLGMPLFADQFSNIAIGVSKGYALKIDIFDLSYEEFAGTLKKLLTDNSYTERAREASRRFRDRPLPPLEEAVFWVEYVLRHGPEALKTAASDLAWYQYLLLDVIGGVVLVLVLLLWALRRSMSAIFIRKEGKTRSKRIYRIRQNPNVEKKND